MITTGSALVGGGRLVTTEMFTRAERLVAPWSSVALAVRWYSPATTFDQTSTNGPRGFIAALFVVTPRLLVPSKNSTVLTLSFVSSARATI